ncbi:MAG TPA: recombinase family protein [Candidatus Acidoferrales bacterium]|nr:recombinase family protein [Candidatus Acidoferrales bacterium]
MKAKMRKSSTEKRLAKSEIVEAVPLNSSRAINRGKLTCVLYLRVSTDKQEAENQAVQLRSFARKQNWQIVHEYCDHESGAKSNRVEFQRMFTDASRRKFDLLLFWSLDRLSREGCLPTLRYLETLTRYGVEWRSFTEQFFDSCGPFRDAVISIMATLARQERIRISERTIAGLQRARAAGKILGRPRREVDVAKIRRLRRSGKSWREVARAMGVNSATCFYRLRRLRKGR